MAENRDLTPDNGSAPPFAKHEPARGEVGTGNGYSGPEYDSTGQAAWRAQDTDLAVAPGGDVRGSGSPDEEIDPATPGSSERDNTSERTDSNGQQNVEDRPNVSTVTPEDYPDR